MNSNSEIADKLEELVDKMFKACQTLKPTPREYLLFREKITPEGYWIILIFFKKGQLNKAIKNGTAYKIHEYFYNKLKPVEDLDKFIFFEEGEIPENSEELNELFSIAIEKLLITSDNTTHQNCNICNHNANAHKLLGEVDKALGHPTKGWLTCPEENCNCFRIWDHQNS